MVGGGDESSARAGKMWEVVSQVRTSRQKKKAEERERKRGLLVYAGWCEHNARRGRRGATHAEDGGGGGAEAEEKKHPAREGLGRRGLRASSYRELGRRALESVLGRREERITSWGETP